MLRLAKLADDLHWRVMGAIADNKPRILLTLATGTGKTFIAFQIAWKLFYSWFG